jgi:phospholipid-binding lipoprotein MlaA
MQKKTFNLPPLLSSLVISSMLGGCASTTSAKANPNDPWQGWNRGAQSFNDSIDKAILKPIAKGYQWITPKPVDEGITNFFSNINDIGVTVNDLLQFKLLQGGKDFSRFLVNTTAGVAGVFDVAQKIDLPKHNEDFGQTLGFWGVSSGNYLVLPFFGSSSPREAAGLLGDALFNPLTYVTFGGGAAVSAATAGARVIDITDTRSDIMSTEKIVDEASVDRYDFIKNAYRQRREYLVYDGNPPEVEDDEFNPDEITAEEGGGTGTSVGPSNGGAPVVNNSTTIPSTYRPGPAPVVNNSTSIPAINIPAPAPVIDNPRHFLDLSAPEKK